MRICLYTETALPKMGGQEMVVDALARQFQALGHDPVVLAPRPRRPLRPDDAGLPYPVVRHPRFFSTHWFVSWYRWFLLRHYARNPFDVLHCHGIYPPGYLAALTRHRLPVPLVITSHGGDVSPHSVRLAKPVVRRRQIQALEAADALIAISRFTREGFLRLCPNPWRIVHIPNGVDLAPFATRAARPASLDPAIQPGRYAAFLGRLKARKGVDLLLEAIASVPPRGAVQLVVIGDGEERPALEAMQTRLNLANRVRFVGRQAGDSKTYLLQNALFAVVPSRLSEAFPLVVLEHFAAGLPVIATRIPGLADVVEPGRTGALVAEDSVGELAAQMREMFADPAAARRMGQDARSVAQAYDWPIMARRHVELYEELRAMRHARAA